MRHRRRRPAAHRLEAYDRRQSRTAGPPGSAGAGLAAPVPPISPDAITTRRDKGLDGVVDLMGPTTGRETMKGIEDSPDRDDG